MENNYVNSFNAIIQNAQNIIEASENGKLAQALNIPEEQREQFEKELKNNPMAMDAIKDMKEKLSQISNLKTVLNGDATANQTK